jgi:hypothetical protein
MSSKPNYDTVEYSGSPKSNLSVSKNNIYSSAERNKVLTSGTGQNSNLHNE